MAQDPGDDKNNKGGGGAGGGGAAANSYAGLSAFFLQSELKMSENEVRKLCADVVRDVNRRGTVLYCNL